MGYRLPKAFPGCTELNVEGATFSRLPFLFSPASMPWAIGLKLSSWTIFVYSQKYSSISVKRTLFYLFYMTFSCWQRQSFPAITVLQSLLCWANPTVSSGLKTQGSANQSSSNVSLKAKPPFFNNNDSASSSARECSCFCVKGCPASSYLSPQMYKHAHAFRSCVAKDQVLNINDFLHALLYQPGDIWLGHSEQFWDSEMQLCKDICYKIAVRRAAFVPTCSSDTSPLRKVCKRCRSYHANTSIYPRW